MKVVKRMRQNRKSLTTDQSMILALWFGTASGIGACTDGWGGCSDRDTAETFSWCSTVGFLGSVELCCSMFSSTIPNVASSGSSATAGCLKASCPWCLSLIANDAKIIRGMMINPIARLAQVNPFLSLMSSNITGHSRPPTDEPLAAIPTAKARFRLNHCCGTE